MSVEYLEREEKWFAHETSFAEEIKTHWGGDWGVASEVGKLKAVLLRRPGREIENIGDPARWRWLAAMDPEKARQEQDHLADIYRQHGVRVYYVEEAHPNRPNSLYMRDSILMTPEGAIVCRHALEARRGEERYAALALAKLGVPIVRTISGEGIFEGACCLWVNRETVILGSGVRANEVGLRQVREVLSEMGVKYFIPFQIPYGHAHVDGLMNLIDRDLAIMFSWQMPYDVWAALKERGYRILEAPSIDEVKKTFACNMVALEPRKVVLPAGNPQTRAVLEDAGVTVIEVPLYEIMKGWGAVHCMTVFLKRED